MGNLEHRVPWLRLLEHTPALLALRSKLERWEGDGPGDPLDAHHRGALSQYLIGLKALAGGEADRSRGVLLAALALGPRNGALPGAGDLGPLAQAAMATGADVVDLAVAWGCGWRRTVVADHEWHGRWVAALLSLSSLVHGSINQAVHWLEGRVFGVREALRELGAEERAERFNSHAQHIAMELALGGCRCGHGSRGERTPCGRAEHQLANWLPEVCHLPAFVATAVRGSSRPQPLAGEFAVSMLSGLLSEDHVVRVDVAEFHVCHVCNANAVRMAASVGRLELGDVTGGLHDRGRCPDCGTFAHPAVTYQAARKNWLIVPADWGGGYDPVRRHRCAGCGNLFSASDDRCPLCRQRVPPRHRLTSVWVRRVGMDARRSGTRGEARES